MDELYIQWEELVAAGETDEDFESWFSGIANDAWDDAKDRYDDERLGI